MVPKGLLPCSQQSTTGRYPESDEFSPHFHTFSSISPINKFRWAESLLRMSLS